MTLLSCLAIGFGFAIAVVLLVLAGALIGWSFPRRVSPGTAPRPPASPPSPGEDRVDPRGGGA